MQLINDSGRYSLIHANCVKVKVHTLDTAPLRSESPPQKRYKVWQVFSKDFTVLPAYPHVQPQSE